MLETIKTSTPSRIINVSSDAYKGAKINFDDLQGKKKYGAMRVYEQFKLANILFTYELTHKLERYGVTSNVLHPGFVATSFGYNNSGIFRLILRFLHLFAEFRRGCRDKHLSCNLTGCGKYYRQILR